MAAIDLSMAVDLDTTQLDDFQSKLAKANSEFLQKMEKALASVPKMVEKVSSSMLKMLSKISTNLKNLVQAFKNGIEQICGKMDDLKNIISNTKFFHSKRDLV